jgi:hypothetical protein
LNRRLGGPNIWSGRFSEEKSVLNSVCVFGKVAILSSLWFPSVIERECKDNLSNSGYLYITPFTSSLFFTPSNRRPMVLSIITVKVKQSHY